MQKKILSIVLALCMLLSTMVAVGVPAFAEVVTPTTPTADDWKLTDTMMDTAIKNGGTIHLNGIQDVMTFANYANTVQTTTAENPDDPENPIVTTWYRDFKGVTVQLNADITANTGFDALTATAAPANVWTAIKNFAGTFDGGYHTISGIWAECGVFSLLKDGAKVQNVTFANCYAYNNNSGADGDGFAGIVAAYAEGSVALTNVKVENSRALAAKESGTACVGGLVGGSNDWNGGAAAALTVTNCSVSGKVGSAATTSTGNSRVGAVIGRIGGTSLSVTDFTNNAAVVGTQYTGGFVGELKVATTMLRCENKATVQGKAFTGGLVGLLSTTADVSFTNCTNSGAVSCESQNVGGIIGKSDAACSISMTDCTNAGAISGVAITGGIIGYVDKATVTATGLSNTATVTTTANFVGGLFGQLNNTPATTISNSSNAAQVTTPAKAGGLVGYVNGSSAAVIMSGCTNEATGTFSSPNHKGGIVGVVQAGSLTINGCTNKAAITGNGQNGGLLGQAFEPSSLSLIDSTNEGNILGGSGQAGGLVGYVLGNTAITTTFTVTNCVNKGNISLNVYLGGLAGITENVKTITIDGFKNFGTMTTTSRASGGIGSAKGASGKEGTITISNSANYAAISGGSFAGGLVGESFYQNISVDNCVNTGSITTTNQPTGGLVGYLNNPVVNANGYAIVMTNSYNSGDVSTPILGGGLIGQTSKPVYMENCMNEGSVATSTANTRTGGLVGTLQNAVTSTFKNCLSLGTVSNSNAADSATAAWVGDIAGTNTTTDPTADGYKCVTFENCYFVKNAVNGTKAKNLAFALSNLDTKGKQYGNVRLVYGETVVDLVGGTVNAEVNWDNAVKAYNAPITDGTLPAMLASADALKGVAGLKILTKAGFDFGTEWHMMGEGKLPVPTTLLVGTKATPDASLAISYKGYQVSNDGNAIRFIAGMDTIEGYNATGFDMIVTTAQGDSAPAEPLTTKTVYQSLSAGDQIGAIKASDLGCTYLSALTFNNVPADCIITLTATLTPAEGEVVSGTTVVIVVANGAVVAQYAI